MGTDNWLVDFKYISTRLVTDIVQQHEAATPRHDRSTSLGIRGSSVSFQKRHPDYDNRFDLALRATEAVANLTGSLEADGPYVRATLNMHRYITIVHQGWKDSANVEIAILASDEKKRRRRTFVALVGSVGNYIGHAPSEPLSGWHPSDADGLYEILASSLEPTDELVDPKWLAEDARNDPLSRLDTALAITENIETDLGSEPLEFLARADYQLHNLSYRGERFAHVLLGAAVWACTPGPVPLHLG
jgi:hypothetical protein